MSRRSGYAPRIRRIAVSRVGIVVAAVVVVLPALALVTGPSAAAATTGFTANGHPNPAQDLSTCSTRSSGVICIRAAEDSILPGAHAGGQGPSKNDPVVHYKWLLNQDNTGGVTLGADGRTPIPSEVTKCHPITSTNVDGNPNYPNALDRLGPVACRWQPEPGCVQLAFDPQHHVQPGGVGGQPEQDWNPTTPIPLFDAAAGRGLQDGKYLVSVTANGYQIGGAHFTLSPTVVFSGLDAPPAASIVVSLNPLPIPLTNIRLKVYGDMASTNAQWDEQSEFGLPGYNAHLTDFDGPVNVDYYNNPLCTAYQLTPAYDRKNHPDPTDSFYQVKLGLDGRPIIDPAHHIRGNFEVGRPGDRVLHQRQQRRHPDPEHGAEPVWVVGDR